MIEKNFQKGITPVIALILMLAIAVGITIIVYAFATGFIYKSVQNVERNTPEVFWVVVEEKLDSSSGTPTLYVYIRLLRDRIPNAQTAFNVYLNKNLTTNNISCSGAGTWWCVYNPLDISDTIWDGTEVWVFKIQGATTGDFVRIVHKYTGYHVALLIP